MIKFYIISVEEARNALPAIPASINAPKGLLGGTNENCVSETNASCGSETGKLFVFYH